MKFVCNDRIHLNEEERDAKVGVDADSVTPVISSVAEKVSGAKK